MSWITLIINTDSVGAELLSDTLMEAGALSVDIHDAAVGTESEQPLYGEPGQPAEQLWSKAEVSGLFDTESDIDSVMNYVTDKLQLPNIPAFRVAPIEDQDWVRLTQSQFDPIQISNRLWIVPTWHEFPDPEAINLILDPGLAFGTGSHPTTQLCLSWLDQHLKQGDTLLDYGCGSGILAIAAQKMGAAHVTGIDIDPHAIKASRANALLNACDQSSISFDTHYPAAKNQVDIVVANILSSPLIMLAPILAQATCVGGSVVLSGILQAQVDEVGAVYQQWFEIQATKAQEGWVLLTGTRK